LFEKWKAFCTENEGSYLSGLFGLNRIQRALVRRGIGQNLFISKKVLVSLLNQIRCEAHREASLQILQTKIERGR